MIFDQIINMEHVKNVFMDGGYTSLNDIDLMIIFY